MMLGIVEFASIGIGNYLKAFANRHQDITKGFGLRIQNHYLKIVYQWICIFSIFNSEYNAGIAAVYNAYNKKVAASMDELRDVVPEHMGS